MSDLGILPQDPLQGTLTAVVHAAPGLATNPSMALSLAQMNASPGQAQAAQQAVETSALATAYNTAAQQTGMPQLVTQAASATGVSPALSPTPQTAAPAAPAAPTAPKAHHGLLADIGGSIMKTLNAPLQFVQHSYRYLHDVEARHGALAATIEGLGIAAGAAGGFALGGTEGAILGGEAVAGLEGQVAFRDSWQQTANGNRYRDPHTNQPVSFGRDISNLIGVKPKTGPGVHLGWSNIPSAMLDAAFDVVLDPLAVVGRLKGVSMSTEGAPGKLGTLFGGTGFYQPSDVDRAFSQYGSVRRAFGDIAQMGSPTQIIARYGQAIAPLAPRLAEAGSAEDVAQVFKDSLQLRELATPLSTLPNLSLTRLALRGPVEAAQEAAPSLTNKVPFLSQRIPSVFDEAAQNFSRKEFNPSSPYAVDGVYHQLLMGERPSVARAAADTFAVADPGQKIGIYRNVVADMLLAKAHTSQEAFDALDAATRNKIMAEIDEAIGYGGPGKDAVYGLDDASRNLSRLPSKDGTGTISAGITLNQTGNMRFLGTDDINRITAMVKNAKNLYGGLDGWVYEHATSPWKQLVLATGAFGPHVALAEAIPNSLREGIRNYIGAGVKAAAARVKYDAITEGEDMNNVEAAVWRAMGKPTSLGSLPPDELDIASRLVLKHNGQAVAPALRPDYELPTTANLPGEQKYSILRRILGDPALAKNQHFGTTFTMYNADNENAVWHWTAWLREVGNDEPSQAAAAAYLQVRQSGGSLDRALRAGAGAATEYLQNMDPAKLADYYRASVSSTEGVPPLVDWGKVIMANTKGVVTGQNGNVNSDLLAKIASGDEITHLDTRDLPLEARPASIKGREVVPDTRNMVDRIANWSHQKVTGPFLNFFSRQPAYVAEVTHQYQPYKALIQQGLLSEDDALTLAENKAIFKMVNFIHNPQERTQFSEMVRNWMPFAFAQEQAYKRMGRFLVENPGAFRQYQLGQMALHNASTQLNDNGGNRFAIYPGTGLLTEGTLKLMSALKMPVISSVPVAFAGSTSSFGTMFPLAETPRPQAGPLVAIAEHTLAHFDPALQPALSDVVGGQMANTALWEQLIPNTTVKDLVLATPVGEQTRGFQSAMLATLQNLAYEGKLPSQQELESNPHLAQDLINRVKNQTRILYILKAVLYNMTPTSPQIEIGNLGLPQELRDLIKQQGNVGTAVTTFLGKHPNATPFTVFQSTSPSGVDIPASQQAMDWVGKNIGFIQQFPLASMFFMPQETNPQYSQSIYNEQVALHLREHKTPQQFLDDLYIASTNDQFFKDLAVHDKAVSDARANGDSSGLASEYANWDAYTAQVSNANPIWANWFGSPDRQTQATQIINNIETAAQHGLLPKGQQTDDILNLLDDYNLHLQSMPPGAGNNQYLTQQQRVEKSNWQSYLARVAVEKPNLKPFIQKVLLEPTAAIQAAQQQVGG